MERIARTVWDNCLRFRLPNPLLLSIGVNPQGKQCSEAKIVRAVSVQYGNTLLIGYMARKLAMNNLIAAPSEEAPVDKFRHQNQTIPLFNIMPDDMVCSAISRRIVDESLWMT